MGFFKSEEDKLLEHNKRLEALLEKKKLERKAQEDKKKHLDKLRETNVKYFNALKTESFLKRAIISFKIRRKPGNEYLIHMEMRNGNYLDFIMLTALPAFKFRGGRYIIDDDLKYYNESSKMWALDYHQDISLPVRHKIDVNKIVKTIHETGITDVDTALNPFSLERFMVNEVIQKVMRGEDMDKLFKFMKIMLILIFVTVVICLIILIQASGLLSGLKVPGLP